MDFLGQLANFFFIFSLGVIATPTERVLPVSQQPHNDIAEDGETEAEGPVKVLEVQGTFDEVMVWGHEILPAADDTFVKGVEEWVRFAETVGVFPCALKRMDETNLGARCMGRLGR